MRSKVLAIAAGLAILPGLSTLLVTQDAHAASQSAAPSTTATAQSDDTESKRADIRNLIEITGTAKTTARLLPQILAPLRQAFPQVPEHFWNEFLGEMKIDDLVDKIVPVYEKYYTHEDIRGLIAFYQSALGQKMIATLPAVMQDSIAVGQQWGQAAAAKAVARLKKEGYIQEPGPDGGASKEAPPKN